MLPEHPGVLPFSVGADRDVDTTRTLAGMLYKITYPTGGFTEFDYECHRYGSIKGVEDFVDPYIRIPKTASVNVSYDDPGGTYETVDFTINEYQCVTINAMLGNTGMFTTDENGNPQATDVVGYASIYDVNDDEIFGAPISANLVESQLCLDPGTYTIEAEAQAQGDYGVIIVNYDDKVFDRNDPYKKYAGGVRIRKITSNDEVEGSTEKSFTYLREDGLRSSGILVAGPTYYNLTSNYMALECIPTGMSYPGSDCGYPCFYHHLTSYSKSALGITQGSHIGYINVNVIQGDGGRTSHEFSWAEDEGHNGFPFGPITSMDWKRGLPTITSSFKIVGSNEQLVRKVTNKYDFRENETLNNHDVIGFTATYLPDGPSCFPAEVFTKIYYEKSWWYQLTSTTIWQDGVELTTNYSYNTAGAHTQPVESSFYNSDGKEYKTKFYYAHEEGDQELIDRFMINTSLKTENFVNGLQVSGQRTEYEFNTAPNSDQYYPGKYWFYLDGTWYHWYNVDYNEYGNPVNLDDLICGNGDMSYEWNLDHLTKTTWGGWITEYDYDFNLHLLTQTTDIHGLATNFAYDDFHRLETITARNGEVVTGFEYNLDLQDGSAPANSIKQTVTYAGLPARISFGHIDGLGRSIVDMMESYSPDKEDVGRQGVRYDKVGRPAESFLPYVSANTGGAYASPQGAATTSLYEASDLNRIAMLVNPDGTEIRTDYGCNTAGDEVMNYALTIPKPYPPCALYKTTVWDENDHRTQTFTDKVGRTILVRRFTKCGVGGMLCAERLDTYTVYDDKGNIIKVITPEGENYLYTYDWKNRVLTKKIPGGALYSATYDACDNVLTMSDANTNFSYTYDSHNQLLQTIADGSLVMVNDYDKDRPTKTRSKILKPDGGYTSNLEQENFYDAFGRVYQRTSQTLAGLDTYTNIFTADDNILSDKRVHAGINSYEIDQNYEYDDWGRLNEAWHQAKNGAVQLPKILMSGMAYNYRDELIKKSLHSKNGGAGFLQHISYQYNVRGWLTYINNLHRPYAAESEEDCQGWPDIVATENQTTTTVGLGGLLDLITGGDPFVIDGGPCGPPEPTGDCTYSCTTQELTDQNLSREALLNQMQVTAGTLTGIVYPAVLHLVQYCDGTKQYVLDSELAFIDGTYYILQEVMVEGLNQTFNLLQDGSLEPSVPFWELIYRRITETFVIESADCPFELVDQAGVCSYAIDQENWTYSAISNTRFVQVDYEKVVTRDCGSGPEEIVRIAQSTQALSEKANTLASLTNTPLEEGGYIGDLTIATWDGTAQGSLTIDLSPNAVTTYGLTGVIAPSDLEFDPADPEQLEYAVNLVTFTAVNSWQTTNGYSNTEYLFSPDVRADGQVSLSFVIFHEPAGPYLCIDPGSSTLSYWPQGSAGSAVNGQLSFGGTATGYITAASPTTCGNIGIQYVGSIVDETVAEWKTLSLVSSNPTVNGDYDGLSSRDCDELISSWISDCNTPVLQCLEEDCVDCEGNAEEPDCDATELASQDTSVNTWGQNILGMKGTDLTLPSRFHQLKLCSGKEITVAEQELGQITGNYRVSRSIAIDSVGQNFLVVQNQGGYSSWTLDQVLAQRTTTDPIPFASIEAIVPCDSTDLNCTAQEIAAQNASVDAYLDAVEALDPSTLTFPLTLYLVVLCDGTELYVLADMYPGISGTPPIIQTVVLSGPEEELTVTVTETLPLFAQSLKYFSGLDENFLAIPQYNGNIAQIKVQTPGKPIMAFGFEYDEVDRLLQADHTNIYISNNTATQVAVTVYDDYLNYDVQHLLYDKDGNIQSIRRNGVELGLNCPSPVQIDDLSYTYSGNRLVSLTDQSNYYDQGLKVASTTYTYDGNG
ncbi:MAG: RHS repeat protein, partial [Phaeodactylibacter sp.]|nr:RHS repeat protein [Phaeodactylibacter sp.]